MNSTVSVFEHDGKQLIVAYSAGNLFAGSVRGDSVWLFSLDGELPPAQPGGQLLTFAPGAGGIGNPGNGKAVYDTACVFCHGEAGEGGHGGGPSLLAATNVNAVLQIVSEGRGEMPPFGAGALDTQQIRDVAAYVMNQLAAADRAAGSQAVP
jgi:mono/diheme cytochrome c family protein